MRPRTSAPDSAVAPASIATVLDPLKGTTFELSLAPDGRVSRADVRGRQRKWKRQRQTGSAALTEQLQALAASFQQLAMPLPTAPIGVGAEWRTSRKIQQNGMQLTSVTTLDVTSLDAGDGRLHAGSEIHGANQTVTQAGMAVDARGCRRHRDRQRHDRSREGCDDRRAALRSALEHERGRQLDADARADRHRDPLTGAQSAP